MRDELRKWIPRWWSGEKVKHGTKARILLLPVEHLFGTGVWLRNRFYDVGLLTSETAPLAVVSIGNIGVGGAGKTPFAAWVAERLRHFGRRPAVVLRGYGEDEISVHRELNPDVPIFADRKRLAGARQALARGCDAVILDDAFQHRALRRDLDIVLISVEQWQGNRRLLPRGPWREREAALSRADLLVVTRKSASIQETEDLMTRLQRHSPDRPLASCHLKPLSLSGLHGEASDVQPLKNLGGKDVLAVASLADPAPFVAQLEQSGARVELSSFPDHYTFTEDDVATILERAGDRMIVMTRKEAVKLRDLISGGSRIHVLDQEVVIESGATEIDRALRRAMDRQIP